MMVGATCRMRMKEYCMIWIEKLRRGNPKIFHRILQLPISRTKYSKNNKDHLHTLPLWLAPNFLKWFYEATGTSYWKWFIPILILRMTITKLMIADKGDTKKLLHDRVKHQKVFSSNYWITCIFTGSTSSRWLLLIQLYSHFMVRISYN